MKKQPELTPWFDRNVRPVRTGVYQQMCGFGNTVGYQYWDGKSWFGWCPTIKEAKQERKLAGRRDPWRGLASDPKAAA